MLSSIANWPVQLFYRISMLKRYKSFSILAVLTVVCYLIFLQHANHLSSLGNQNMLRHHLSHVVLTFHINQLEKTLENLASWDNADYYPCPLALASRTKLPVLTFFIGYSSSTETDLHRANISLLSTNWSLSSYKSCFSQVKTYFLLIDPQDDSHVTGARIMFEHLLKTQLDQENLMNYVLYMEPDMVPIQANWLWKCMIETEWTRDQFWVKGSIFRGDENAVSTTSYLPNLYHINGNAIYNIGSEEFRGFYFETVRKYVVNEHGDSVNAYDTDFFEYAMDTRNYGTFRHVAHKFIYTEFIQNMWQTKYSKRQFVKKYPNTFLVHGGFPEP